jgi:hypothetical protein
VANAGCVPGSLGLAGFALGLSQASDFSYSLVNKELVFVFRVFVIGFESGLFFCPPAGGFPV